MGGHDILGLEPLYVLIAAKHTTDVPIGDDPDNGITLKYSSDPEHLLRNLDNDLSYIRIRGYRWHLVACNGLAYS
jgi:hypothetical protein